MLKKKKEKFKIIIIIVISLMSLSISNNKNKTVFNINNKEINLKVSPINTPYFAKIEIPIIYLNQNLYYYKNKSNNVDSNIEIIYPSEMPDKKNSVLILAAHSGNSNISYFKDLNQLKLNDYAYINYDNKRYTYIITVIERQVKN